MERIALRGAAVLLATVGGAALLGAVGGAPAKAPTSAGSAGNGLLAATGEVPTAPTAGTASGSALALPPAPPALAVRGLAPLGPHTGAPPGRPPHRSLPLLL